MVNETDFDVVICGGGLAGLTLARQLRLELPNLSVAVVDRLTRPLPEAAFKVGESAVELGTYYLGQILQLESYFKKRHLFKLGLRFFMGKSPGPIEERPETGISLFPLIPSYQIDRGRLENDLRQIVEEMGIIFFEGVVVEDILLAGGDEQHVVKCRQKDNALSFTLTARWVVDALGRRRFLQTKLGLKRTHAHQASAAWWRYKGRVDVDDLAIGKDANRWRSSTIEERYYSTNHMTDTGYWVWLIPLGSDSTSVGIVTDETIHPQKSYGQSYEMALEWLHQHEPALWQHIRGMELRGMEPLDFLSLKNYSYTSAQVFSHRRWSCVGEAGFFLDPLYSIGTDFVAIGNTITVEMIRRERAGELTETIVAAFNRLVLDILFQISLGVYRGTYCVFGHAQIFTSKFIWDTALHWAFNNQLYLQGLIRSPTAEIFALGERYKQLNDRVQQLFIDWSKNAPPREMYLRCDLARMHFIQLLHLELAVRRDEQQTIETMRQNLGHFEALAQVLFWQALEECYPENALLKERPWINVWHITLDPEKWADSGMFDADTSPRPLNEMRDNFTGIFAPQSLRDRVIYNIPFNIIHWHKGFLHYHVTPLWMKRLIRNKPAMWVRRLFVTDFSPRTIFGKLSRNT